MLLVVKIDNQNYNLSPPLKKDHWPQGEC